MTKAKVWDSINFGSNRTLYTSQIRDNTVGVHLD